MEQTALPLEVDEEGRALTQHQGSSTGSGSSTGTPYYTHKNGKHLPTYSYSTCANVLRKEKSLEEK